MVSKSPADLELMIEMKHDYWVPQYKWELVNWLSWFYNVPKGQFTVMKKIQLLAIYHKIRSQSSRKPLTDINTAVNMTSDLDEKGSS